MGLQKHMIFKAKIEKHHWCIVNPAAPAGPRQVGFGATITNPPPVNNPLQVSGSISGCCNNPTIQVSLTDSDGDTTYATPINLVGGPPPTGFNTTFPPMPSGDYTLSVMIQCGNEVIHITMNATLP